MTGEGISCIGGGEGDRSLAVKSAASETSDCKNINKKLRNGLN